jgi:hypothetical protein
MVNTSQQVGGSVGTSIGQPVLDHHLQHQLHDLTVGRKVGDAQRSVHG